MVSELYLTINFIIHGLVIGSIIHSLVFNTPSWKRHVRPERARVLWLKRLTYALYLAWTAIVGGAYNFSNLF